MSDDTTTEWRRVIYAHDCIPCPYCDELLCPVCIEARPASVGDNGHGVRVELSPLHYFECPCPGPHQSDEYEYREIDGVLYARLRTH